MSYIQNNSNANHVWNLNKMASKQVDSHEFKFWLKGFKPHLQHHSQILGMVDYEMCNECNKQNSTKVLHLYK
jgi:hypothetical protein